MATSPARPLTIGELRAYLGQIGPGHDDKPVRIETKGGVVAALVTETSPTVNADELWLEGWTSLPYADGDR